MKRHYKSTRPNNKRSKFTDLIQSRIRKIIAKPQNQTNLKLKSSFKTPLTSCRASSTAGAKKGGTLPGSVRTATKKEKKVMNASQLKIMAFKIPEAVPMPNHSSKKMNTVEQYT